jgi:organic radical activating enzyme
MLSMKARAVHWAKYWKLSQLTPVNCVTVTGGEPLAQKPCPSLLAARCDRIYSVSVETGPAVLSIFRMSTREVQ